MEIKDKIKLWNEKGKSERGSRLTIIKTYNKIIDGKEIPYCLCKCDCGNTKELREREVLYGLIKSCGCKRRLTSKENAYNMGKTNRKQYFCSYCGKKHYAKGLCRSCYARALRNNGSPKYIKGGDSYAIQTV